MPRDRVLRTTTYNVDDPGPEAFIRPARDEDSPELARIMPAAFPLGSDEARQYGSPELMRLMILGFGSETARAAWFSFLVATHPAGGVIGACVFRYGMHSNDPFEPPVYNDVAILDTLAVHPQYRHKGAGRALVRRAEQDMRIAGSRVMILQCPMSSAGFYDRCGYQVEADEVKALTFFPRQGQKVFTSGLPHSDGDDQRIAWRSLTGSRSHSAPYTHASRNEPATMVRGVIPGDGRRFPDWPDITGFVRSGAVMIGGDHG